MPLSDERLREHRAFLTAMFYGDGSEAFAIIRNYDRRDLYGLVGWISGAYVGMAETYFKKMGLTPEEYQVAHQNMMLLLESRLDQ